METALRETVEELLGVAHVPSKVVAKLEKKLQPFHVFMNNGYVVCCFSFEDLKKLLKIVRSFGISGQLYKTVPSTVEQLVLERKQAVVGTHEVQALALLPFEFIMSGVIDIGFAGDIMVVAEKLKGGGRG